MSADRSRRCAVVLTAATAAVALGACARVLQPPVQHPAATAVACGPGAACTARSGTQPAPREDREDRARPEEDPGHRSDVVPAVEIVALNVAVNLAGRLVIDPANFEITSATIRRNLRSRWVVDDDPFQINQFGHPYQGAMYHGIARSNGLGYWPSAIYTFAGSALWEIAGETTPPSRNDQIASGVAGSFLGEPLFRISRLLLERADSRPGVWRKLGAVLASPPTGINHALFGDPAGSHAPDAVPLSDIRVQFGVTATTAGSRSVSSLAVDRPRLALSMDYGYPGNASYRHDRPFDYFRIESSVSSDGLEHLSTRGLIAGADYGRGRLGGIWGLYGGYDYLAPDDFRFASTAVSLGTTLQAPIVDSLMVQSSGLVGAGYVAVLARDRRDGRDFHYGLAPQALVNLRLIAGRRAALDVTAREYFVTAVGGFDTGQRDLIFAGDASFAIRVYRRHALGVSYQVAGRSSDYLALPDRLQSRTTVGVYYTFLGSGGFGAVR
jgi:hypothetical protein